MKQALWVLLLCVPFAAQNRAVTKKPPILAPSLTLTWMESTPSVTSFNIYRGTTPGGENYATPLATVQGAVLLYKDTAVALGTSYCYTVTAVLSVESQPSNEVCMTVPVPPNPPVLRITSP